MGKTATGEAVSIHQLWNRRHTTKFNGVSYAVQKAAAAIFTPEGRAEVKKLIDFYMENARLILQTMEGLGFACSGGTNAPYVWIRTNGPSWELFDRLLQEAAIVCTPGAGFGTCGEGHIRLSAFNSRENVEEAMRRIQTVFA
jgi:LL-diaminopimelate aminotransferase